MDSLHTRDGLTLHTINQQPDGPVKAAVLLVHGIGEHSGRYTHVLAHLAENGYAVYAIDHRGHGRSEGLRFYLPSFDLAVDDLALYLDQIEAAHPDRKVFVYGHSMGALIGLLFVLRYQGRLAGFVSSGTPLTVGSGMAKPLMQVAQILAQIAPKARVIMLADNALSQDPAVEAAIKADPLVNQGRQRIGTVAELVNQAQVARSQLGQLHIPLLVLHGGGDKITPPSGSDFLYAQARSADKTIQIYSGLYHELHNEPEKAQILADIVAWLNVRE
jgi:acylglycerol lipase